VQCIAAAFPHAGHSTDPLAFDSRSNACVAMTKRRASPSPESRVPVPDFRPGTQRGFTLLEIVVVMAIIAAAAVLGAMAVTGGFERMRLQSATKQITANLRYTRAQAIATGTPQRFVVDPHAHAWQTANGRHGTIPATLDVNFTGAREVAPAAGTGAIVFFADGASTGGRVQIASQHAAWNVDVAWLTGEVTLRRAETAP
jgi:general secretion pathway protein H